MHVIINIYSFTAFLVVIHATLLHAWAGYENLDASARGELDSRRCTKLTSD